MQFPSQISFIAFQLKMYVAGVFLALALLISNEGIAASVVERNFDELGVWPELDPLIEPKRLMPSKLIGILIYSLISIHRRID